MFSRVVACTNPVLACPETLSHPDPTHQRTDPQDPPACASSSPAPQSETLPDASPSAPWAEDCGDAAMRSERITAGSPAGTSAAGRFTVPSITARPAAPPGSSGSANRVLAASSMPDAVRLRSGTPVPA